jgi:ribosome biogenesis protein UTP30
MDIHLSPIPIPYLNTMAAGKATTNKQVEKPKPSPLPKTFSKSQAKKAVDALYSHHAKISKEKEETELLPQEEYVWLVLNLKRGTTRRKLMPVRMYVLYSSILQTTELIDSQLPHPPLPPPPATSVCLITKDPQREYKDLLASPEVNVKFINRVVGVAKLKGKFKPFEARRELMRDHELFLCDERISQLVPGLLGKMFFEAKK